MLFAQYFKGKMSTTISIEKVFEMKKRRKLGIDIELIDWLINNYNM